MGWGNCGTDSKGRPIGYVFSATCDAPGCKTKIDRGLAYACGGMHGKKSIGDDDLDVCEGYFCEEHRTSPLVEHEDGTYYEPCVSVCISCARDIEHHYIECPEQWLSKAPIIHG